MHLDRYWAKSLGKNEEYLTFRFMLDMKQSNVLYATIIAT